MSFGIRSRTTTENCVTGACIQPSYFDQRLQPRGMLQPPGFVTSRASYFVEICYGYVFGVKKSNGVS